LQDDKIQRALVFTRTKYGADKVAKLLSKNKIQAEAIHGNKSQNARQRALSNFKEYKTRVLVATDIAARGIDVDDLDCVINFEIPNIAETYVHRIGRTGRAGAKGTALSFCDAEEKEYLKDIEKLISKTIEEVEEHPFPLMNHEVEKKPKQPQRRKPSSSNSKSKYKGNNKPRRQFGKAKTS
jgi:ATP-dependent RNA helicase RhlE